MVRAAVDDAAFLYSRVYCQNQQHSKSVAEDSFGSTMAIVSQNLFCCAKIVLFSLRPRVYARFYPFCAYGLWNTARDAAIVLSLTN